MLIFLWGCGWVKLTPFVLRYILFCLKYAYMSNFSLLGCLELILHFLIILRVKVGGSGDPKNFLQISLSWVIMSFNVKFHLRGSPGTGQKKFCGGWVVLKASLVFSFGSH